jgi:putative ATP-dependent endonuclease of OLD family
MRLEQVTIRNFLSVKNLTLDFDNVTVLIGPNNHGKSNILRALDFFFNGCDKKPWEELVTKGVNETIEVQATFSDVTRFIPLLNTKHQGAFRADIGANDMIRLTRRMPPSATTHDGLKVIQADGRLNAPTGTDSFLSPILPRFEFIPTSLTLGEVSKMQKTNRLGKLLFDILDKSSVDSAEGFSKHWNAIRDLLNNRAEDSLLGDLGSLEAQIAENLRREFPECTGVSIVANLPSFQELTKGFSVSVNDGILTDAEAKGDGVQRALVFSILRTYQELQTKNRVDTGSTNPVAPIVFALDEAELHLHPRAQRDLAETLQKIGAGSDQVVLTTHSFVLAQKREGQKVHAIQKDDSGTSRCPESKKGAIELLGVMPSDVNLPDNVIIVEGASDAVFLEKLLDLRRYGQIAVHYAEGDAKVVDAGEALNQMFKTIAYSPIYRERVCVMVDHQDPKHNHALDFKKCFCNHNQPGVERVLELDEPAIEYCYPKSLMKELYGDCSLSDDALKSLVEAFLQNVASSHDSKADWGNLGQVSKVDLAKDIAAKMTDATLAEIESQILGILDTAKRLSSF